MLDRSSRMTGGRRRARTRALVATAAIAAAAVPAALGSTAVASAAPTQPPPLTVLSDHGAVGRGDIFLTPSDQTGTYADGAEIVSRTGKEIWFHPAPAGDLDGDFRTQTYQGHRVLTFWEGSGFGGLSDGTDYIYNDHYKQIAEVHAGNGLTTDGHEFLITPWNTALILSYDTATADLTSIGGPANQTVIDGIVQEIDIKTGRVLFSWNSADHVPYSQSEQPLPSSSSTPWDWFHVNAVHLDRNGKLLIDARNTWTTYEVSPRSGKVLWQLGGKASSFALKAAPGQSLNNAGELFAWQHDPESIGHGEYTFFDNESAGVANTGVGSTAEFGVSRVITVRLDKHTHTATLVASDDQPEGQVASSQGNGQRLPGGGEFVGWGNLNSISQFNASGKLVFNAEFPTGVNTYRAYLLPWGHSRGKGSHGSGQHRGTHHRRSPR